MNKLNLSFTLLILFAVLINAQTFIAKDDSRNQATFESNAALEDIVGVSNYVEATAVVNPTDLSDASGTVKVNLTTLKTGIDLRDEHLRSEQWLNTDKFPHATFELKKIEGASTLEDGKVTKVKLHGDFSVHGITKSIVADGELTYFKESEKTKGLMEGNLLKVTTNFTIKLAEYGVTIPDMVIGKVNDEIKVSANFVGTDAAK
jgi:polyisoprenoid-binding protein YceI